MLIHITKMKTKTAGPKRAGSGDRLAWNSNGSPVHPIHPSTRPQPTNFEKRTSAGRDIVSACAACLSTGLESLPDSARSDAI